MAVRAVFDCMVFLQGAARADGPAAACLRVAESGHVDLFVNAKILDEVRDVLTRPKIRKKFSALTPDTVAAFLQRIARFAHWVAETPAVVTLERDPKDEKYLDLAAAADATHLVSRDRDLLDLMDDSSRDAKAFRSTFPHLTITDPVAFLKGLELNASEEPPGTAT